MMTTNDRLALRSFRKRNAIYTPQGRGTDGTIRYVPYSVGAVYPYSSKRQNERNARRYGKQAPMAEAA